MTFSLDYDNTFSADSSLWRDFTAAALARGHRVVCVSGRDDMPEHRNALAADLPPGMQIVLCSHRLKRAEALRQGVAVDVWIDDTPEGIGESRGGS